MLTLKHHRIFLFIGEEVDYQLQLVQDYDITPVGDYAKMTCGIPGNAKDLFQDGFSVSLGGLPYRQIVEKAITIPNGIWCDSYTGIQIQAIAACEADMSVYQYGVIKDPQSGAISISYDSNDRIYASSSTATIPDFAFSATSGAGFGGDAFNANSEATVIVQTADNVQKIFKMMLAGVLVLGAILIIVGVAIYQLFRVKMHTKSTYRAFSTRVLGGNKPGYEDLSMAATDDHPDALQLQDGGIPSTENKI